MIDWCDQHQIGVLIIGHNDLMKQSLNLGKRNNQQLVNIPHDRLIEMLTYKAQLKGIKVIITEESYTSQSSCLDRDELPKYGDKKPLFKGKVGLVERDPYSYQKNGFKTPKFYLGFLLSCQEYPIVLP